LHPCTSRYARLLDTRRDRPVRHDARVTSHRTRTLVLAVVVAAVLLIAGGLYWDRQRTATAASATTAERVQVENIDGLDRITVPAEPDLLIMGDSYTEGYNAANARENGWAYLVARALNYPRWTVDGVGGTGWSWGGGDTGQDANKFGERITRLAANGYTPNLVVFQGGQNDYRYEEPQELTDVVAATIQQARDTWPGVQIVVMTGSAPQPLGDTLKGSSDAIKAAALATDTPVIDPLAYGWFTTANSPQYANFDGSHLNTEGHRFLAERFLEQFAERGGPNPPPPLPAPAI
jgi:acyl-CoA thioesterase-1